MTRNAMQEVAKQMLNVHSGTLFHYQEFESGNTEEIIYEFGYPEYEELRIKYDLVQIVEKGSNFIRTK